MKPRLTMNAIPDLSKCQFCCGEARIIVYGGPSPMKSYEFPKQRRSLLRFMAKNHGFYAHVFCGKCCCHGPISGWWDIVATSKSEMLDGICAAAAAKWNAASTKGAS
jgi:hypothetical protein